MKRAALYSRFSTDLQSAASCEDQLRTLREECARRGWTVAREFRDAAISGASMFNRPALIDMLREAEHGGFDVVMAEALDRLSRDDADMPTIRKRLAFHNVGIFTLSEGDVQILHVALKGAMNAMFLEENVRKSKRGMAGVIADGRHAGGRVYGYRPVPGEPGRLVIHEAEAAIVRRIFADYIAGHSPRAIALRLNAEGVPGVNGKWKRGAIKGNAGWGMLHNRIYAGELVWNRRRSRKDPQTGKRGYVPNPPSEWRRQDVPELRLIDDATWRAAQDRAAGLSGRRGAGRRPQRLFSGLLRCATCGGPMHSYGKLYYGCYAHHYARECPNVRMIRETEILDRALAGLTRELLSPAARRSAARAFRAEMARLHGESDGRRPALTAAIADASKRIARLVAAVEEGAATPETAARIAELEARRANDRRELAGLESHAIVTGRSDFEDLYHAALDRVGEIVTAAHAAADRGAEEIRRFLRRIDLTPLPGPRGYGLVIHGDLADFFNLGMATAGRGKCPNR
jgi:site-specific DNA recombinase